MNQYELIVINPFNDYKRGDIIKDQSIVEKIIDPENEMHEYDAHVRKILKKEEDRSNEDEQILNISSVKDEEEKPEKSLFSWGRK